MVLFIVYRSSISSSVLFRPASFRLGQSIALQWRRNASKRPAPGFDTQSAENLEQAFRDIKIRYPKFAKSEPAKDSPPKGLRKYGITPMRLIVLSIVSYLGYEYYVWESKWAERSLMMNGRWFSPLLLESKDQVSSTCAILNLKSVPAGQNMSNIAEAWKLGVWSVQVKQHNMEIARSYTPLPPNGETAEQIRLLVRREPQGEVSRFLHQLPPSSFVHVRGPHPEYIIAEDVEEVVFLAGGTGIAPALQVAYCLFSVREPPIERRPKMHILWANRRREDSIAEFKPTPTENFRKSVMAKIRAGWDFDRVDHFAGKPAQPAEHVSSQELPEESPLIKEIEAMKTKYGDRIDINYFVDEDNTYITEEILRRSLSIHDATSAEVCNPSGKKLLLISGPEGFVNAFAGPKVMVKGREIQGPIGGVLGKINPGAWDIWKL